jgi:hypothetical protein
MMTVYEVFYNNGYRYPDYAVWCEGEYPTLEEAKNHKPWYSSSVFERIDRVEYDADGFVINRQMGIA